MKRYRNVEEQQSSEKKIRITDFFSPKQKPVNQQTVSLEHSPSTSIATSNDHPKDRGHELEPRSVKTPPVISPPSTPINKTRPPLTPRVETPNLSSLHVTTPRLATPKSQTGIPHEQVTPRSSFIRSSFVPTTPSTPGPTVDAEDENYLHLSYKFLDPSNRRDIKKRTPKDADYDERTLYVPESFLDKQTPALRQWWLIKQRNMDAVLFFKMGKFYELFNEDAVIGVKNLDINYMKGDETKPAHAGFPEVSYEKYSKMLIEKGFKVLRIEQTETPAMMEERCQATGKRGKFEKVVAREVCRVTTKGTQMPSLYELSETQKTIHPSQNQYLLAIRESDSQDKNSGRLFGVCFVDVTISKLFLGQFEDDHNYSTLNIMLSHHKPTEIIYERSNVSCETNQAMLRSGALLSPLKGEREFWTVKKALSYLRSNSIFTNETGNFEWPSFLKDLFDRDDSDNLINHDPKSEYAEGLHAFGAIVYYLQSQLIADQVLKCATFNIYNPPTKYTHAIDYDDPLPPSMILDHIALKNLEIFENSEGTDTSTLYESINQCQTPFGRRLLKNWICSPLCDVTQINNRLDAVEALVSNDNASFMNKITEILKPIPDLERILTKIKSQSFKSVGDSRAIMFDGQQHSRKKIESFVKLLGSFKTLRKFIASIGETVNKCGSRELEKLLTFTNDDGLFPDYKSDLEYFDKAFDHVKASKTGTIIPAPGVDTDHDNCEQEIMQLTGKLEDYLEEQKRVIKCRDLEYFGTAKNRFQIQIPEAYCNKVPDHYRIETTRKGFKRYYTPQIDKLFQRLTVKEEEMKKILDNTMSTIFAQFSRRMSLWSTAIDCIAQVDVLQSIAGFVRSLKARDVDVCRPQLISSNTPFIEYTNGRHPALVKSKPDFIPNDLRLDEKLILLTGANMGGKSTIMRQTALLTILAQIGCFVPASNMTLTPVDRIFSRLGASDRLLEGESTFYTELVETSAMLRYATKHSLLLLDELGRGTSTYDGTAIAYAVTDQITEKLKCRCLFSTHYHCLVRDFEQNSRVRLAHMGCKVERNVDDADNNDIDIEPLKESITFLYKITDGPVARSYGFNVAKLAGIEDSIISVAYKKSKELELSCKILEKLQNMCTCDESEATKRDHLMNKVIDGMIKMS